MRVLARRFWSEHAPALARMGVRAPFPIQLAAREPIARREHVLLHAETGSGKTLAYVLPALRALDGAPPWSVLVVAPTDLLAEQIARVARALALAADDVATLHAHTVAEMAPPHATSAVDSAGGASPRAAALRARMIVATPNGLLALRASPAWRHMLAPAMPTLRLLVLDEVDVLLRARAPPSPTSRAQQPTPSDARAGPATGARGAEGAADAGADAPPALSLIHI